MGLSVGCFTQHASRITLHVRYRPGFAEGGFVPAATGSCHSLQRRYIPAVKASDIGAALTSRPFRHFELRADGEVVVVRHPEQVFFAERKSTVIVDAGDRIHILDVGHISKLALLRRAPRQANSK